jgi:hypothetical protein
MAKVINLKDDDERIYGTSFHGDVVTASANSISRKLGIPFHDYGYDGDKVTHEFDFEIDGIVATLYDWKEYHEVGNDEVVEFHIGARTAEESHKVASTLRSYNLSVRSWR